jgi:PAS domain S-box-containing protein
MNRGFERDDLMAILDSIDDAVIKLDGQAQFVAMNQAAITIYQRLGLDPQQMKGKSVWELFPDLKGTLVERELHSVIEEHMQTNFEFYYPNDQHWYEIKGYSVPPGAVLVFRDITDKKSTTEG